MFFAKGINYRRHMTGIIKQELRSLHTWPACGSVLAWKAGVRLLVEHRRGIFFLQNKLTRFENKTVGIYSSARPDEELKVLLKFFRHASSRFGFPSSFSVVTPSPRLALHEKFAALPVFLLIMIYQTNLFV